MFFSGTIFSQRDFLALECLWAWHTCAQTISIMYLTLTVYHSQTCPRAHTHTLSLSLSLFPPSCASGKKKECVRARTWGERVRVCGESRLFSLSSSFTFPFFNNINFSRHVQLVPLSLSLSDSPTLIHIHTLPLLHSQIILWSVYPFLNDVSSSLSLSHTHNISLTLFS